MTLEIRPLTGAIGAEIRNVALCDFDRSLFPSIRTALLEYGVIYFRDQAITPEQQLGFARLWGEVHLHPYLSGLADHPEIIEIVKEPDDAGNFGDHWHTDQIFTPEPAMATMLYAKEVPEVGGDTMFACMAQAYDALSTGMQAMLQQLRTYNQYDKSAPRSGRMRGKIPDPDKPTEPSVHPLVRVHPETGRPALYLTDLQTTLRFDTMTEAESRPLITFLLRHATQPAFTCRLDWQPGTLGLWDNRRLMHMALNDYPGRRRVMHRITIKGTRPIGLTGSTACADLDKERSRPAA